MAQPPMKWAVSGMPNGSPMLPPAVPPRCAAMRRTVSLATGIQVGFGAPWPCFDVMNQVPNGPFLPYVVIELSRVCMTSAMTVRSDQCLKS